MKAGYLRRNGIPYSENAVITEYYDRFDIPNGDSLLLVTTEVNDPMYLSAPFWTSTHFKKQNRLRRLESNCLFSRDERERQMKVISMKTKLDIVLFSAALFAQIALFGQTAPPSRAPNRPSPAIDLSGYWSPAVNEDGLERGAGSEIGDYAGFAINEAGRLWALSYDPSRLTLKHHQCDGYVAPYQMRAIGNFRIWEDRDPHTMQLVAIHIWAQTTEGFRMIWMDGRPHPPAWAPHTYQGFSTGKFVGNALWSNHAPQAGLAAAQWASRKAIRPP